MSWLDAVRAISAPWYARFPVPVTIAYVLLATLAGFGLFQLLFLTPAKKEGGDSSSTTINFNGANIEQLTVVVQGSTPVSQIPAAPTIVENGGFEQVLHGWGTGFFEGLFLHPGGGTKALGFNNAVARWYIDDRLAHSGKRSLRVEHKSPSSPHAFSSFSQRIKVKPSHRYEATFWAYLETPPQGAFSLRVLPSRRTEQAEWDRFKRKIDPGVIGRWQEVRVEFESGADWFFDLRFAAEAPLKVWVDDVSVTVLGG